MRFNLQSVIWWRWLEGWVSHSVTWLGWSVKIKSIQHSDWGSIWLWSGINCIKPCVVVRESICVTYKLAMSLDYHSVDLALKSPKIIVNWDFKQSMLLRKFSKPDKKDSNSEVLWLGDLCKTATYPFLLLLCNLQTWHSVKDVMFTTWTVKALCNKYKHHPFWYYLDDHFKDYCKWLFLFENWM